MNALHVVTDTVRILTSEPTSIKEIVGLVSGLVALIGTAVGVGVLVGRHAEFKSATNERLQQLEKDVELKADRTENNERLDEIESVLERKADRVIDPITRHELNALLETVRSDITNLAKRFEPLQQLITSFIHSK